MVNLDVVLAQLRQERDSLNGAIAALESFSANRRSAQGARRRAARTLSAAGRKRIAAAQKARWAKWRKQKVGA